MSYMESLEQLEALVTQARSVPLSASAVIPRDEVLALIKDIKETLPAEHQQAVEIVDERERLLTEAHEKSAFIIEQAREERSRMLSRAEVVQAAEAEAKRIMDAAQTEAARLAHQADDYVDAKMANVEIVLNKLLRTIGRGREQLHKRLEAHSGPVQPLELDDSGEISGPLPRID